MTYTTFTSLVKFKVKNVVKSAKESIHHYDECEFIIKNWVATEHYILVFRMKLIDIEHIKFEQSKGLT